MKVRVWLPFRQAVPYSIEVEKLDLESIKKALKQKNPADWDYDPNFYEVLGSLFDDFIESIASDDIEL